MSTSKKKNLEVGDWVRMNAAGEDTFPGMLIQGNLHQVSYVHPTVLKYQYFRIKCWPHNNLLITSEVDLLPCERSVN